MRRLLILLSLLFLCVILFVFVFVPVQVERNYGHASPRLTLGQRYKYALRLFWHDGILTAPSVASGQSFTVNDGEPTFTVAQRLEAAASSSTPKPSSITSSSQASTPPCNRVNIASIPTSPS